MALSTTPNKSQKAMITSSTKEADKLKALTIKNDKDYELAGAQLIEVSKKIKALEAERKRITDPLHQAKTAVMDLFRKPVDALKEAKSIRQRQMVDYDRIKEAERRKIQEEQEEKARKEQAKKIAAAKRKAKALEKKGKPEEAEALVEEVVNEEPVVAPTVASSIPQTKGVYTTTRYHAEVVDKEALIKAIARKDPRALLAFVEPNQTLLNKMATSLKEEFVVPGVKLCKVESKSVRTS